MAPAALGHCPNGGLDPEASAVELRGKAHEAANVHVADEAIFVRGPWRQNRGRPALSSLRNTTAEMEDLQCAAWSFSAPLDISSLEKTVTFRREMS